MLRTGPRWSQGVRWCVVAGARTWLRGRADTVSRARRLGRMDRPGDLGGSNPWKDAESCQHSGSPGELRERAVKTVFEIRERDGKGRGEIARVAGQLGIHREVLRTWIRQAEIDGRTRSRTTTEESRRIAELERENRELRRAKEILKAAMPISRGTRPRLPR